MTTEKMITNLEKQGYTVKKIDIVKRESWRFRCNIILIWTTKNGWSKVDLAWPNTRRGHSNKFAWSVASGIINECIQLKGYKTFSDIPEDKRDEVQGFAIEEGWKIMLERYGKKQAG